MKPQQTGLLRPCVLFVLTAYGMVSIGSEVQAEDSAEPREQAQQLFERGVVAGREGEAQRAVELFRESFELFPLPGTLLNLGLLQLQVGEAVNAHRTFGLLLEQYDGVISERARAEVTERLRELDNRLVFLRISTRPAGALVTINGVSIGRTPLAPSVVVEPGEIEVEATLSEYEPATVSHRLRAGQTLAIDLALSLSSVPTTNLALTSLVDGPAASIDESPPTLDITLDPSQGAPDGLAPQTRPHRRRLWPWITIGGVALATSLLVTLLVVLPDDDLEPTWIMRVR